MAQVFISYARKNRIFVHKLVQDLRRQGVDLWLDQLDLSPGGRWDDQVQAALKTCQYLLVVLPVASVTSQNVKDEIGFAVDENKTIIPILYQRCEIPLRIRRLQYIDFQGDYEEALTDYFGSYLHSLRGKWYQRPSQMLPPKNCGTPPLHLVVFTKILKE